MLFPSGCCDNLKCYIPSHPFYPITIPAGIIVEAEEGKYLTYVLKTEAGMPIENAFVTIYDLNYNELANGTTNNLGNITFTGLNTTNNTLISVGVLPEIYTETRITSIKTKDKVFLNDILSGTVRLSNFLGALEGKSCNVMVFENKTGTILINYKTQCNNYVPYINPLTRSIVVNNCSLSDSDGDYYFTTIIREENGYQYGKNYTMEFNCDGMRNRTTFYVDVPKPPDVESWFEFGRRYSGIILIFLGLLMALIIMLYLIKRS
jgi:hypothetical protein